MVVSSEIQAFPCRCLLVICHLEQGPLSTVHKTRGGDSLGPDHNWGFAHKLISSSEGRGKKKPSEIPQLEQGLSEDRARKVLGSTPN